MNRLRWLLMILCFLITIDVNGFADEPTVDEIIRNVQRKLENIELISAEFMQTFFWSIADETQEFAGQIYIGKNDEFRIKTPEQLIVSDGISVWTEDKVNRQVIIDKLDMSQNEFLPRQIFIRYKKNYRIKKEKIEQVRDRSCYHLVLMPKNQDVFIQKLEIWVDKEEWLTRKISYMDVNDNVTTYLIQNIKLSAQTDAKLFRFVPNSDFEVIDMREE